jgi:hypothetical protein
VGNRRLGASWLWWYFLRPFIGVALALVLYFVIRGGLLPVGSDAGSVSLFGIAAISSLAGMFSKQATDKLGEVFDTLFRTEAVEARGDALEHPVPSLATTEPKRVRAGSGETLIAITGSGFIKESVVRLNGADRKTEFGGRSRLTVWLPGADLQSAGTLSLTVFNPGPGGGVSNPVTVEIEE